MIKVAPKKATLKLVIRSSKHKGTADDSNCILTLTLSILLLMQSDIQTRMVLRTYVSLSGV